MASPLAWAHFTRPFPGEPESGDLHLVASFEGGVLLAVIDGLGHGPEAAAAARAAARVLAAEPSREPLELQRLCHHALRGSRGAAALVVSLRFGPSHFLWAGIGNIEGYRIRRAGAGSERMALISTAGVVGYQMASQRQGEGALAHGDLFVLATDGISPEFMADVAALDEPDEIAAAIAGKHARTTDDALVLVARYGGARP